MWQDSAMPQFTIHNFPFYIHILLIVGAQPFIVGSGETEWLAETATQKLNFFNPSPKPGFLLSNLVCEYWPSVLIALLDEKGLCLRIYPVSNTDLPMDKCHDSINISFLYLLWSGVVAWSQQPQKGLLPSP